MSRLPFTARSTLPHALARACRPFSPSAILASSAILGLVLLVPALAAHADRGPRQPKLTLTAPDLERAPVHFERLVPGFGQLVEHGQWIAADGWPQAQLIHYDLTGAPRRYFAEPGFPSLAERIAGSLRGARPLEAGEARSRLGTARYRRFALGDAQCVYLRQLYGEAGAVILHGARRAVGKGLVEGWYCAGPERLTGEAMSDFVQGVGVRGRTLPPEGPARERMQGPPANLVTWSVERVVAETPTALAAHHLGGPTR